MDYVNDFFAKVRAEGRMDRRFIYPRITCADGFSMSVQGHFGAYCSPRANDAMPYSSVEVGYPSAQEDALMRYAENPDEPTDTVYGYVPVSVVNAVIEAHGGLLA